MSQTSSENLDKAFALLEQCAVNGERCPVTSGPDQHAFLRSAHTSALAKAGRILIEISSRNFRRITILVGPHKGKKTTKNPDVRARVYQTVGAVGHKINRKFVDHGGGRGKPSVPRFLTREELSR
jgi:hypothetical protein